jgi:hypothetical protein
MDMPTIVKIRNRLAKQILFFNILVICIAIVYYTLHGFDKEELSGVITLLTSLAAIYIGVLSKYIGDSFKNTSNVAPTATSQPPFGNILQWIVPIHYIVVIAILSVKAFTRMTYSEMNLFLGLLEASFGGYIGYIISAIFGIENNK